MRMKMMLVAVCTGMLSGVAGGAQSNTLRVPGEYPTIQAAIDVSADGDTVLVADGTYTGPGNRDIDFGGRAIEVRSENGAAVCTIDVQANELDPHRAFYFETGEPAEALVEGFTITNGFMDRGGAVLIGGDASPRFYGCVFIANTVQSDSDYDGGGAVFVDYASAATFTMCEFAQNHLDDQFHTGHGGAIRGLDGSDITITDCLFSANSVTSSHNPVSVGGAIQQRFGTLTITRCTFDGNTCEEWAGAVFTYGSEVTQTECLYTGNSAAYGGAVVDYQSDSAYVDCVFEDNYTFDTGELDNYGGAYVARNSSIAAFTRCTFDGNSCQAAGGAVFASTSEVTHTDCLYTGNSAIGGGAIHDYQSNTIYTNCVFEDNYNTASDRSGGAYIANYDTIATFTECRFTRNSTPVAGGSIVMYIADVHAIDCVFELNSADRGGAVYANGADTTIVLEGCSFDGNSATRFGGGLVVAIESAVEASGCAFTGNQAGDGGALYFSTSSGTIESCVLEGNSADRGGAVAMVDIPRITLLNCLIRGNSANNNGGGVFVFASGGSTVNILNTTIADNLASNGGAIRASSRLAVANSILYHNSPNEIDELVNGYVDVTYSDVQGGRQGTGNIDQDPMFIDLGGGDLRLAASSRCIDAADNTAVPAGTLTDVAGDPRFHDDSGTPDTGVPGGDGGSQVVDMGAYEFQGTSCYADFNGDGVTNTQDVLAFLNAWTAGDPYADCNGDGSVNTLDVLCFLNSWAAGC